MSGCAIDKMNPHQLAAEIKQFARRLGFDLVGIAPASPSKYRKYYRQWLDDGRAGVMDYLDRRFDERVDPAEYFPGARSVVCVALNYYADLTPSPGTPGEGRGGGTVAHGERPHPGPPPEYQGRGKVARYALGDDYHELIKHRLYDLSDWIRDTVPGAKTKCGVDTVPVMEKELAARAGIGWMGKNTCIINEQIGSWLLLGEVLTTLELPFDDPAVDRCGTCRKCIDACPTAAITAPYQLDATKCISYLTIELAEARREIPKEFHGQMGEWLFGCDICQDVCPWNKTAPAAPDPALAPRFPSGRIDLRDLLTWRGEDYSRAFRNSAVKRVKLPVLQRNAKIILDNLEQK
ncbi:MAG TPA: tRNA epoxyqueuosine(34) reductase QueG [Tepidisphaeraceae bacterium]